MTRKELAVESTKRTSRAPTLADRRAFWASLDPVKLAMIRNEVEAREQRRRIAEAQRTAELDQAAAGESDPVG